MNKRNVDFTDFSSDLNGWEKSATSDSYGIIKNEEERFFGPLRIISGAFQGGVLSKSLDGLSGGAEYVFSVQLRRGAEDSKTPRLSLRVAGHTIAGPIELVDTHWHTLYGKFILAEGNANFEVFCSDKPEDTSPNLGNFNLDTIRVGLPLLDVTTFDNKDFNGWTLGAAAGTPTAVAQEGENYVLVFDTHRDAAAGIVLSKRFTELVPGTTYRFSLRARSSNGHQVGAQLSVLLEGVESAVIAKFTVTKQAWLEHVGEFEASGTEAVLQIHNATAGNGGNDYRLDDLTLEEVMPVENSAYQDVLTDETMFSNKQPSHSISNAALVVVEGFDNFILYSEDYLVPTDMLNINTVDDLRGYMASYRAALEKHLGIEDPQAGQEIKDAWHQYANWAFDHFSDLSVNFVRATTLPVFVKWEGDNNAHLHYFKYGVRASK
ncbi:Carbohydrate binding domain protein [compost metagenome]